MDRPRDDRPAVDDLKMCLPWRVPASSAWKPTSPTRWFDFDAGRRELPLLAPHTRWVGRRYLEASMSRDLAHLMEDGDHEVDIVGPGAGQEIDIPDSDTLSDEVNATLRRRARRILCFQLRKYFFMRTVALYWQERTQRALCAPEGAGRAADVGAFESDFAR